MAQKAYVGVSEVDGMDYNKVKEAILHYYNVGAGTHLQHLHSIRGEKESLILNLQPGLRTQHTNGCLIVWIGTPASR